MPCFLRPEDFIISKQSDTLVRLLLAHERGEQIISQRVVSPQFIIFAESKGCELKVSTEFMGGADTYTGWTIFPIVIKGWNIGVGDVVKDKYRTLNNSLNMNVLNDTELLAEVDYFDNKLVNRQIWVLKADLDLVNKADNAFRNAGE